MTCDAGTTNTAQLNRNLVEEAQAGNARAFEQLLEHNYEVMFRFAFKWCGNRSDAEDVVQLACVKLARALASYRFEAAFTTWLYRLVINCAKDWVRSQERHKGVDVSSSESDTAEPPLAEQIHEALTAEPSQDGHAAEQGIYLQQVLNQLDAMAEGYKETVLLVHGEGLSHQEAAVILDVKESTISWRLHDVRKRLKLLNHQEANL